MVAVAVPCRSQQPPKLSWIETESDSESDAETETEAKSETDSAPDVDRCHCPLLLPSDVVTCRGPLPLPRMLMHRVR